MRKARHLAISSRLEATKQYGLVEDFSIEWPGGDFSLPRIRIRSRAQVPPQMTLNYVATLLETLVPTRAIEIERQ